METYHSNFDRIRFGQKAEMEKQVAEFKAIVIKEQNNLKSTFQEKEKDYQNTIDQLTAAMGRITSDKDEISQALAIRDGEIKELMKPDGIKSKSYRF
jgi:hypothetical protein